MQRKELRKKASAFALAAAMTFSLAATPVLNVDAAKKTSVNVVTTAKSSSGDTVNYTYNKKGLVTKSVSKSSYKDGDSDSATTVTTTYKYNKKNKIATKTTKTVTKVTYYEMDKTTGTKIAANKGTVTYTTTEVTKFTYNKKGLATQSVATTTSTQSGSVTETDKDMPLGTELSDGKRIAGYNSRNADGSTNSYNNSTNAYYYTGNIAAAENVATTTTTYTANANGGYTETKTVDSTGKNFKLTNNDSFYKEVYVNGATTIVPVTALPETVTEYTVYDREARGNVVVTKLATPVEGYYAYNDDDDEVSVTKLEAPYEDEETGNTYYYKDANGKMYKSAYSVTYYYQDPATQKLYTDYDYSATYNYQDANGKKYYDYDFKVCGDVTVDVGTASSKSSEKTVKIYGGKTVTTTKYSYDKKNRVTKAVATMVDTESFDQSYTYTSDYSNPDAKESSKTERETKSVESSEYKTTTTTTYSYDKKGRVKKEVYTVPGKTEGTTTSSSMTVKDNTTNNYATYSNSENRAYDTYPTTVTTTYANGTKSVSTAYNKYTETYSQARTNTDEVNKYTSSYTKSGTRTVESFDNAGKGGFRTTDTFTETNSSTNAATGATDTSTKNGTNTSYEFDRQGKSNGYVNTATVTTSSESYPSNSTYYFDGSKASYDTDAAAIIIAPITALVGSATPYTYVESKADLAKPSKRTTTYTYDKNGNKLTAKTTGTYTEITDKQNETYGNTIYEFTESGSLDPVQVSVEHKYTDNITMENTVKAGTQNLTKALKMNKYKGDRSESSGYGLSGRIVYKLKAKKYANAAAKIAKKQQWILQNGHLNGEVGL